MAGKVQAPFPYAGGKSVIADEVWSRFGDPYSYLEPFCGSAAVLLNRPAWHKRRKEVIGDLNGYVANALRAIAAAPVETARHAWHPSIHADLTARHRDLVAWGRAGGLAWLKETDGNFDAQVAGWWMWGISNWISISDFCRAAFDDSTPWDCGPSMGKHGVQAQKDAPDFGLLLRERAGGRGVQATRKSDGPDVIDAPPKHGGARDAAGGVSVKRKTDGPANVPDFGSLVAWDGRGCGVSATRKLDVFVPDDGFDLDSLPDWWIDDEGRMQVKESFRWVPWFYSLSKRLAQVTIKNDTWDVVLKSRSTRGEFDGHTIGVFLDPPYRSAQRASKLYALDDADVISDAVWEWAKKFGSRPDYRIAFCALDGDYDAPPGWSVYHWRNSGMGGGKPGKQKRKPGEVVLFSPYCFNGGDELPPAPPGALI